MSTYWELLRDPRWQRKRLEVMEAAGFRCEECGREDRTLNVHHKRYRRGAKPWEYHLSELRCLCENCHSSTEEAVKLARWLLSQVSDFERQQVIGYMRAMLYHAGVSQMMACDNDQQARGIADAFGILLSDMPVIEEDATVILGDELFEIHRRRLAQVQVADAIDRLESPVGGRS